MYTALKCLASAILLGTQVLAKTPVSQTVFNDIVTYAGYAAAAYGNKCLTPQNGAKVVKYFNNVATDTQGTLFYRPDKNELVMSFRGTSAPADYTTDFTFTVTPLTLPGTKCPKCGVHSGFQTSYASIATDVTNTIKAQKQAHPGATLIVTGHSLGAALASLASSSLSAQGVPVTKVYTYGEPLNGNSTFTTYIQGQVAPANYFRVTHFNDGVPQIPPPVLGFQHHGIEYWESQNGTASAATTYQCPGVAPQDCNFSQKFGSTPINEAHLFYGNGLIGNALHIAACGATPPLA